jgi:tetratricopeptide (TPR) repeat protein
MCLVVTTSLAIDTNPETNQVHEYLTLAQEHRQRNEIKAALNFYNRAIELDPTNFNLIFEVANFLSFRGHTEQALAYYDRAADICPDNEQVYFNKGVAYNQLNQHEKAAECFLQAIDANRLYERAHLHAVKSFRSCKKIDKGIEVAKRSVKIINNNAELHYRYGLLLKDKELYKKALKQFAKAVHIDPLNKHYLFELGVTLYLLDEYQEALYVFERLLELDPADMHVLYNFGTTLKALGFIDYAIKIYNHIIDAHPAFAPVQFARSLAYLACGDFERGLPGYEWRWKLGSLRKRHTSIVEWTGKEDLTGKTLLICAEQGFGDTGQFIRYADLAHAQGARIIVEVQPALKDILKLCPYIDAVYTYGQKIPHADYQISLLSMPLAMGTTLATIPQNVPYLFADPHLVAYWKEKLKHDQHLKIGICWQGNRAYNTAELRHAVATKSFHPALFAPIARLKGVTLYNLQKGMDPEQLQELPHDMVIHEFDEPIDTEHGRFMDTLALMSGVLDLIITIDTSTCHMAGAVGAPVWTLLPHHADWRWLLHRSDTPWYESMRLFRQPRDGDWQTVIEACCNALQEVLDGHKSIAEVTQEKGYAVEDFPVLNLRTSSYLPSIASMRNIDLQQQLEPTCVPTPAHIEATPFTLKGNISFDAINDDNKLKNAAHELIMADKELRTLHEKLKALPELSPFDCATIDLFRACVQAYDRTSACKTQLSSPAAL